MIHPEGTRALDRSTEGGVGKLQGVLVTSDLHSSKKITEPYTGTNQCKKHAPVVIPCIKPDPENVLWPGKRRLLVRRNIEHVEGDIIKHTGGCI